MPLASDRTGGINTAPITAIGNEPVTPAVGDLMQAFRQGFITVDDLTKRGAQLPVALEQSRQDLADQQLIRPLARQAQAGALTGEIQIQPRKQELQAGQVEQAITALPTPAEQQASTTERAKAAQIRNGLASSDPNVRLNTIANLSADDTMNLWTAAHGQPPPEQFEIKGVGNALRGTPEYTQALKDDLKTAKLTEDILGAQLKAIPPVLEAQAKAAAEAPSKESAKNTQQAVTLQREYGTRQEIQDLRKVQAAYYKLQNLLDPKSAPTAAKDQGAIFSWMKILDPGSTVREGEYATAKNARGVPETIRNYWNQVTTGQILTPQQRTSFQAAVEPVYFGQVQAAEPTVRQFLSQEEKLGATGEIVPPEDAKLVERAKAGTGISSSGRASSVQVGDIVTLKDGRKVKVKAVTATGIVPDESYTP